jgi:hypothetical protein
VELHAQAAAGTLRAVVGPEAPLRAALLRRGAAGRGCSPGEAARPWLRLRPLERGCGGAEALAGVEGGGGAALRAGQSAAPGRCSAAAQGGAGRGTGVPTVANGGSSPQPTQALPRDPPTPAAGVQDCHLLQRRLISAQCCERGGHGAHAGSWSCNRGKGTTSRRGLKPVYIIHILETHKISESVAWMKDTGC